MKYKEELEIPWPPSVNHYWFIVSCKGGGRKVLGKRGKDFRQEVQSILGNRVPRKERFKLSIEAYPPDRRKRDLDNVFKATLDSLEHGGLYEDDNQIDEIHIYRKDIVKEGKLKILIEEL
jgi:crossover junction endodeoxyribonuclease RusA